MEKILISEFPDDDQYWRVDWIDRVQWSINAESVPEICVFLTALKDDWTDQLKNDSLTTTDRKIFVNVSFLLHISIGSVWHKKSCFSVAKFEKLAWVNIDTSNVFACPIGGEIRISNASAPPLPRSYYSLGKQHFKDLAKGQLAVIPVQHKDFSYLVIPSIELLKTYYMMSDLTARYVFQDRFLDAFNVEKSGLNSNDDLLIHLRKTVHDQDAYVLGRWLCSEKMRTETKNLYHTLQIQTVNQSNSKQGAWLGAHINIGFPFDGKTKLAVSGKKIQLISAAKSLDKKGVWALLVLQIHCCNARMPYNNIFIDRDNNNFQGKNADDPLPTISYPPKDGSNTADDDEIKLTSQEEPSNKHEEQNIIELKNRFPDLINKPLNKNPKDVQKFKSAGVKYFKEEAFDAFGASEGTSGDSSTGPVRIEEQNPFKENLPTDILTFISILQLIRESVDAKGWRIRTIGLGDGYPLPDGDILAHLPAKVEGLVKWHLISSKPRRPRAVAIAQIDNFKGTQYLLELERKTDQRSVVLLTGPESKKISDDSLKLFLLETARNRGWPDSNTMPFLKRHHINHLRKRTAQQFADALIQDLTGGFSKHSPRKTTENFISSTEETT